MVSSVVRWSRFPIFATCQQGSSTIEICQDARCQRRYEPTLSSWDGVSGRSSASYAPKNSAQRDAGRLLRRPLQRNGQNNVAEPFESSRRKLARSKKHITDLDWQVMAFLNGNPYAEVREPDPQRPNHIVFKIKLVRPLPSGLDEIVGDAVNNMRSALDHAGYEIAVASGRTDPQHAYFPIFGSAANFDKSARSRCKDVPDEIFAFFRALKPYKGGNDLLWALNRIAVGDKHRVITAMGSGGLRTAVHIASTDGYFEVPECPVWDPDKHEIKIATFGPGASNTPSFNYEFDFFAFIAFDKVEVIGGEPVVPVLNKMASIVDGIILGIEAEAKRLGYIS